MTVLAVPLLVLSTLAQTPAPRDLVARAVTAMGGETAVRGLRGSAIDFYQAMFALGQEETPASPARANLTIGRQTTDYTGNRVLITTEGRNPTGAVNKVRRVIAGGVLFPRQVDIEVNNRLQTQNVATAVNANPELPDTMFAIPDSIAARAQRSDPTPPPVVVTLVELAPNVWRAEGGTHHSLIVDQGTRLLVVEAPLSALRMEAMLDTLRSRFPGKAVGLVINTHHHWDHSGGLRAVLAAGVPVVTQARNVSFVRSIATARKTIRPDILSRRLGPARPPLPAISGVEGRLVIGRGD